MQTTNGFVRSDSEPNLFEEKLTYKVNPSFVFFCKDTDDSRLPRIKSYFELSPLKQIDIKTGRVLELDQPFGIISVLQDNCHSLNFFLEINFVVFLLTVRIKTFNSLDFSNLYHGEVGFYFSIYVTTHDNWNSEFTCNSWIIINILSWSMNIFMNIGFYNNCRNGYQQY